MENKRKTISNLIINTANGPKDTGPVELEEYLATTIGIVVDGAKRSMERFEYFCRQTGLRWRMCQRWENANKCGHVSASIGVSVTGPIAALCDLIAKPFVIRADVRAMGERARPMRASGGGDKPSKGKKTTSKKCGSLWTEDKNNEIKEENYSTDKAPLVAPCRSEEKQDRICETCGKKNCRACGIHDNCRIEISDVLK